MNSCIAPNGSKTKPFLIYAQRITGENASGRIKRVKTEKLGAWHGSDAQDAMTRCQRFYDHAAEIPGKSGFTVTFAMQPEFGSEIYLFDRGAYEGAK